MTKKRAKDEVLGELHIELAKQLLAKIKSGEATPADFNAAIKFLDNNHIEANTVQGDTMDQLREATLPIFDDEEQAPFH